MTGDATIDAIRVFVALIAVAGLAAIVVRRLAIPYTVTLVVVGLVAAAALPHGELHVAPEVVLLVLVPGLVFEAALGLDLDELRRTFGGVALLAIPGVLLSTGIVALVLAVATGLPLELGFVVGAIVAATDPVAVVTTFRRLGSPPALTTLVEGESLFNDGTALVIFTIAVRAVEQPVAAGEAILTFVTVVVVSIALGLGAGWLASRLISSVDDRLVELTLSVATAYGTYLVADAVHESGIIATVVAGVVLANDARAHGMAKASREALDLVWEFIAFVLTALTFLLVGLAMSVGALANALAPIAWGVVAILIGRALVVYGLLRGASQLLRPVTRRLVHGRPLAPVPIGWLHVLFWAGLRGAVAVAMALSLPTEFPQRELLQSITFGIVLFTLFVQGTTAEWLVRRATSPHEVASDPATP
jgi:CPA1 family monovalent cation:H+ antiporter